MPLDLTCPTCGAENTQRLSIMKSQQTFTGSAGQTALAAHLRAPRKPWGFTIGLVGALAVWGLGAVTVGWARNPILIAVALLLWPGTGWVLRRPYLRQRREWERYLDAHFICLRCGALFKPGRDVSGAPKRKVCLSPSCARQIPRDARSCTYCGATQVPRLAKA